MVVLTAFVIWILASVPVALVVGAALHGADSEVINLRLVPVNEEPAA